MNVGSEGLGIGQFALGGEDRFANAGGEVATGRTAAGLHQDRPAPILADTEEAAKRREADFAELAHPSVGVWMLSEMTGFRLYDHSLDALLPTKDIRANNPALGENAVNLMVRAEREPMTIRDAARIMVRSRVHQSFVGTPDQLAGYMSQWLLEGGSDGFNILPPFFPGELALFVDHVIPALQRRNVFRRDYSGPTLRDHLGLLRPSGRPLTQI